MVISYIVSCVGLRKMKLIEREGCVLSNYLLTGLQHKKRKSFFLNEILRTCDKLLSFDIVLMPNHQESRDHWSVVAIYLSKGLIVYCDSLPHASKDHALLGSI